MIVVYITYFFYLLIYTYQLRKVYDLRFSSLKTFLILLIFLCINGTMLAHQIPYKIGIVFLSECVYYGLTFKLNFYETIMVSLFFNLSSMIAEFTISLIFTALGFSEQYQYGSFLHALNCLMDLIINASIDYIIVEWFKNIKKSQSKLTHLFLLIFPLSTLYLFAVITDPAELIKTHPYSVLFMISFAVSNFILLYFYANSLTAQQLKIELLQTKQKEERLKDKYSVVCSQYEKSYKYLHDLIHTCSNLMMLVDTKNYSQLKENVSSLASKTSEAFNLLCSNSIPLNMVLNVYRNQFQDLNIVVNTTILADFDFLSKEVEYELYDILIQSCIACCQKSEKRFISISLKELNNKAYLKVMCPLLFDVSDLENFCHEKGLKIHIFEEEWTTLMICKM